ncbi:MAG: hypothetical protein HY738_03215 [Bacteroidia bacterium]|nr:hypothetical protein [Bacteroidia bacterium]
MNENIKKNPYKFLKPVNLLRYGVLALTIVTSLAGSMFLLIQLDPFSVFGKAAVQLFKPVYIGINNLLNYILQYFGNYSLYTVNYNWFDIVTFIFALSFLILIIIFAYFKGKLYCNSIYLVVAFLGLASKISLFRITINKESCNSCGLCA